MTDRRPSGSALHASTSPFAEGAVVGVGSLPHRDASAAAAFAISEFDIATIPTLPNLSRAETMLGQAIVGRTGLDLDDDGAIEVADREAPAASDLSAGALIDADGFAGFRAFLDLAGKIRFDGTAVKWQFVGPVTLGVALQRAGLPTAVAFDLAQATVRSALVELSAAVTAALPNSPQMVIIDEPSLVDLMSPGFPIPPDEAIDRMSGAMAALPTPTLSLIHI